MALLLSGLVGCASAPPPKELVSARKSYERARGGAAAELAPLGLRDARAALDQAERAFSSDRESLEARDLAYIAERKAQLAESLGSAAAAERNRGAALRVYGEIQIALRKRAAKAAEAAKLAESEKEGGAGMAAGVGPDRRRPSGCPPASRASARGGNGR